MDRSTHDPALAPLAAALRREKFLSCLVIQSGLTRLAYARSPKFEGRLQKLNSCTKSVLSTLVGIALDEGLIPALDTPVSAYFPDLIRRQGDGRKARLTLAHLLTMTDGLDWPEFGEWQFFAPMAYERDIPRFVLGRRLLAEPGAAMNYNSGSSHLLAAALHRATGGAMLAFAEDRLFRPLGVRSYHWYADSQGVSKGADGLRITSTDMAKLGALYLQGGRWEGRQVVSERWVRESTQPRALTYTAIGAYGYHWWVSALGDGDPLEAPEAERYFFALGFGGQLIAVLPALGAVVVFTSELYDRSLRPLELLRGLIIPALLLSPGPHT